jgi:hypothetical protein
MEETMGRPTKFDEKTAQKILAAVKAGNTRTAAARMAGIAPSTFHDWRIRAVRGDEPYAAFAERLLLAEGEAEAEAVRIIHEAARSGTWQAAAWWLERRHARQWLRPELPEPKPKTEEYFRTEEEREANAIKLITKYATEASADFRQRLLAAIAEKEAEYESK